MNMNTRLKEVTLNNIIKKNIFKQIFFIKYMCNYNNYETNKTLARL